MGGRLKTIRKDAQELQERLEQATFDYDDDAPEVEKLVKEAKGLVAEYLALDMMSRNPNTKQIDPQRLEQNVPWSNLENVKKNPDKNPVVQKLTEDMGQASASMGLAAMAELSHADFIERIQNRYRQSLPGEQARNNEREVSIKERNAVGPYEAEEKDLEQDMPVRSNTIAGSQNPENVMHLDF